MENLLKRLAKQLQSVDEASLMSLWDKYQEQVKIFEPTKKWEESVIIFCMIQSIRWKNQLFNSKWAEQQNTSLSTLQNSPFKFDEQQKNEDQTPVQSYNPKKGKIIPFRSDDEDKT